MLSIILPSLRPENFNKCATSIFKNTTVPFELISVLPNPDVGTSVFIGRRIVFIKDDKCIGTVYAINKGLEASKGDWVVTLSDDARVLPGWDTEMFGYLQNNCKISDLVIGSFRVYDRTGELGDLGYYNRKFSLFPLISKATIEKLGGYYSSEFNAYYSDPDLGMRCAKAGGLVATCPTAWIYHSYNPDEVYNQNKSKYFQRDEEVFKNKWGYLGPWEGCKRTTPNIRDTHPQPIPNLYLNGE